MPVCRHRAVFGHLASERLGRFACRLGLGQDLADGLAVGAADLPAQLVGAEFEFFPADFALRAEYVRHTSLLLRILRVPSSSGTKKIISAARTILSQVLDIGAGRLPKTCQPR